MPWVGLSRWSSLTCSERLAMHGGAFLLRTYPDTCEVYMQRVTLGMCVQCALSDV